MKPIEVVIAVAVGLYIFFGGVSYAANSYYAKQEAKNRSDSTAREVSKDSDLYTFSFGDL